MLSGGGKICRISSTLSTLRERNFRPQSKVIKYNVAQKNLILFNLLLLLHRSELSGYVQQLNMCMCVGAELHSQLLAVETEMNNKNKEIQNLAGSLTDAMVSKERLEQRVMELVEMSQHSMPDDSLQARVQVRHHTIAHSKPVLLYILA